MTANEDLLFVELALKRGLVTQEEVDEILSVKEKLAEMGLADSVADLMVKKGVLKAADADAVRLTVSPKGGREQIKGYRLLTRIGRGGMGSVYKAVQISMERTVALKVLKPSLVEDDQSTSRLRREAQLVGQLRHPNIVQGLDFGVSNSFHYFAMEYVDGESARQILVRDGRMKEADAIRIITDIAKALEHAHQEGVVHRDVKPGNILVAKDGTAMLADYGLAKGPLEDAELTRSGVTVGTPQYISPEQAQGPKDVDIRTDIYSLGATLYHMLAGRPPYEGETLAHLIQQVLYEEHAPVRSIRRDISPDVAFLVAKMMARKPAHRYQSPKALLKDLQAIEEGRSIVPAGWEGSIEALAVRKRVRLLTAFIVILFVLGGGGAVLGLKIKEHNDRLRREEQAKIQITAVFDNVRPDTYAAAIEKLDELFRKYEGTEAAETNAAGFDDLRRQERYVRDGNDLAQLTVDSVKDGQHRYADALRRIRRFLEVHDEERAKGEGADWARKRARELRDVLELQRNRFVVEEMKRRRKALRTRSPEEARDELGEAIGEIRSQAYVADETAEELEAAEQLERDLRNTTGGVRKYLAAAEEALESVNYSRADSLLRQDRTSFQNHIPLNEALRRLEPEWSSELERRFTDLERDIREANQAEWVEIQERAQTEFLDQKHIAGAVEFLTEFADRSVPDLATQIRGRAEELSTTLEDLRASAGEAWDDFLPRFLEFLGNRSWAAAGTEIDELGPRLLSHQPNDWERAWHQARETLNIARAIEGMAADALHNQRTATLTFGTIRETMHDLQVDRDERSISWSRQPGGPRQKSWLRDLSVEDLFRVAGVPESDPPGRFVRALLRLGEVARMSELPAVERELDLIEGWIGEARKFEPLESFADEALGYVRKFEEKLRQILLSDELRAEAIFREAEAARKSQRWQEAYDKFRLLLEERKLRETKFVRDVEPSIKAGIKEAEQNLPGAKVGEYLRAKVRHTGGVSWRRGNYEIIASWDFRERNELERWRFTDGRIELVEVTALVAGPELAETRRRQGRLNFLAPENGRSDWLQNHPLRLESPLLYSEDMSISFRARWKEPLALVVSLRGTNVVVLSDDGRKENGRGVHIWQSEDLTRPARAVPDVLRRTYIDAHPNVVKGDAANHRYFQFEPNRWYRIRFEKRERFARLYVSDRLVHEEGIRARGAKARDIVILTWTPCELDDLELRGTVDPKWYRRRAE